MIVRKIVSIQELEQCLEISLTNFTEGSPVPVDRTLAWENLKHRWLSKEYVMCVEDKGKIVGWFNGFINTPYPHSRVKALSLSYIHTSLKGFKAVRLIQVVHQAAIEYAKTNKCYCVSSSSILDTYEVFNRILAKEGWIQYGCIMSYKISY
jgi:hypothetical protein